MSEYSLENPKVILKKTGSKLRQDGSKIRLDRSKFREAGSRFRQVRRRYVPDRSKFIEKQEVGSDKHAGNRCNKVGMHSVEVMNARIIIRCVITT